MKQQAIRPDVRETVMEATDRLFKRYGYRKTTVEDIAQEAHISRATFYLYFRNKEEAALAWLDRYYEQLHEEMRAIAGREGSPVLRVREMLTLRVRFGLDTAERYSQSIDDLFAGLRAELLAKRAYHQESEARIVSNVLAEGQEIGLFDVRAPDEAARAMVLAMNALLPFNLSDDQRADRAGVEAQARVLAELLLRGVEKR